MRQAGPPYWQQGLTTDELIVGIWQIAEQEVTEDLDELKDERQNPKKNC
jgi:hypothetical protein